MSIGQNDLLCSERVADSEPPVHRSLWVDGVDEACNTLLAVDDPQGVRACLRSNLECADAEVVGVGLTLPKKKTPEWIPAKNGIEEIEDILGFPTE